MHPPAPRPVGDLGDHRLARSSPRLPNDPLVLSFEVGVGSVGSDEAELRAQRTAEPRKRSTRRTDGGRLAVAGGVGLAPPPPPNTAALLSPGPRGLDSRGCGSGASLVCRRHSCPTTRFVGGGPRRRPPLGRGSLVGTGVDAVPRVAEISDVRTRRRSVGRRTILEHEVQRVLRWRRRHARSSEPAVRHFAWREGGCIGGVRGAPLTI